MHQTFYSDQTSPESPTGVSPRNLVRTAFDFKGYFSGPGIEKVFEIGDKRYKHLVEPEVTYRYINGVSEFDRVIQFDEHDIISDSNEVEYSIANRFFSRRSTSDGGLYNKRVSLSPHRAKIFLRSYVRWCIDPRPKKRVLPVEHCFGVCL